MLILPASKFVDIVRINSGIDVILQLYIGNHPYWKISHITFEKCPHEQGWVNLQI